MSYPKADFVSSAWKDDLFRKKVVFCTGGNGTICSAQVRALVYLGADACIVGRNEQKTKNIAKELSEVRTNARVLGIGGVDVRQPRLLQTAIDRCVEELGGIDLLIVGAAGNFLASIEDLSPNAFKTVIDIDTLGSYNTVKLTLPHLVKSVQMQEAGNRGVGPSGRVIFVSATMHYTGYPLQAHVSAAKAAVDAIAVNFALEYGPFGVTSNIISPGPIGGTEGMRKLSMIEKIKEKEGRRVPLQRYGSVKDIADATVYLFSDAANYVNGEVLVVDGGAWRVLATGPDSGIQYPENVLTRNTSKI